MCGISGYFGNGDGDILKKMNSRMNHRGPDDRGFFVEKNIGLSHNRLSIIDISSAGHQPMGNEDKSVWISFNGEIYNFKGLKGELRRRHKFTSNTDTEVIIHLYEEIGTRIFEKLNGMFAIAIYDKRKNKIILARDRMGKKPLYWGLFNKTFVFGSELKSVIEHPDCKKEMDLKVLNKYFLYEYIPTPHSIFKNIYKLEPGYYIEYDGREIKKNKFWKIEFNNQKVGSSPAEVIKNLDELLNKAISDRLMSDVPLGVFLSGGLDSSIVSYYAQKNSANKIKTFSIGFKEKSFDESSYARRVAKHLGTEHHEKILDARDSLNLIENIGNLLDEPMADASIVPTFLLSKYTRENVTVALGGDGSDELFCGYDTFIAHKLGNIYEKSPQFFRKNLIEKAAIHLPTSFDNISFDFKVKKFISGFYGEKRYRNQRWLGAFDKDSRRKLFLPEVWSGLENENEFEEIDYNLINIKGESDFNQFVYLYLRMYMLDDILVKVDRASMFNSLEVRSPFLDYRVVDFANSIPDKLKMKGFNRKYILKKLMENKLPKDIIYRKKKGFGIPLSYWFNNELKYLVLDFLSEERIKKGGIFDYKYINKILKDHFSKKADNRKFIWTLMVFEMWRERWYK